MLCSVKTRGGAHRLASPAQPWTRAAPAPPATLGLVHPRLPTSGVPFSICAAWRLSRTHSTTQNSRALLHGAFPQTLRPPRRPSSKFVPFPRLWPSLLQAGVSAFVHTPQCPEGPQVDTEDLAVKFLLLGAPAEHHRAALPSAPFKMTSAFFHQFR